MFSVNANLRILIVDGYADAADSMALLLAHWGHEVRVAYNGLEALTVARQFRPHVVFAELKLDGIDGFRMAELLRREHEGRIQLIALTGQGGEAPRRHARQCGYRSYLLKPTDPERIRRLLVRAALAVAPSPTNEGTRRPSVSPFRQTHFYAMTAQLEMAGRFQN